MKRKKVAVIFGGCSTEYYVSLQSAYSVITHLDPKRYQVIMIGITQQGDWMRYYGAPEHIADDLWMERSHCVPAVISPSRHNHGLLEFHQDKVITTKIDVVFPVLHGKNGEDGTLQGLLELSGIPFVGCATMSSALCMDKDIAHKIVTLAGVQTPPSVVLRSKLSEQELLELVAQLHYPLFVKPVKAGSSLGITKVIDKKELMDAIDIAFQHDRKVIVEEAIDGFEIGCAIFGNDHLTVGELDEIQLEQGFFDYTEKYTLKTSKIYMPARIDVEMAARVRAAAMLIYGALDCSGFARVDLFLTSKKEIIFNEVNTIPGFTSHSRYPSMMKGIGMTFEQIIDRLIRLAVER